MSNYTYFAYCGNQLPFAEDLYLASFIHTWCLVHNNNDNNDKNNIYNKNIDYLHRCGASSTPGTLLST